MCDRRSRRWPRPRWRVLYTVVGAAAVATAIARAALPASLLRSAVVVAVPLVAGVAMAVWVATNRVALDLTGWCECAGAAVRVRVVGAPAPRVTTSGATPVEKTTLRA